MSKNLILIIGILLIWFLMIRKTATENETKDSTESQISTQTTSKSAKGLKMSKTYTL